MRTSEGLQQHRDPPPPDARDDEAVFRALFHRHYEPLCEFVRSYVRSSEVAEELVQDLFVRLWTLQSGRAPQALAVSYLYTAARNRAIGHLRRERVARRYAAAAATHLDLLDEETPADAVHGADLAAAVEQAVAALPARCRLIFTMSRQQHMPHAEIARALGVSVNTVETQISRALRALRARLAPFVGAALALACSGLDAGAAAALFG
jgi:RNA polymerase sigma-70 factor, ECF subfamily